MAKLKKTFNASLAMHTAMAGFLFLLMETVGLWFVNYKMNIPAGREFAANVVYQMSGNGYFGFGLFAERYSDGISYAVA